MSLYLSVLHPCNVSLSLTSVSYLAPVSFPRRLSGSEGPLEGPVTSDYPLLKLPLASPSDPFHSHPSSPPTVVLQGTGPVQNNTCIQTVTFILCMLKG